MPKAKAIKTQKITEDFIFEDYPTLIKEADDSELEKLDSGYVSLPGAVVFQALVEPSQYEQNHPTFNATFRIAKDTEYAQRLFATIDRISRKTWKENDEAIERLEEMFGAIAQAVSPRRSPISVQDGDQIKPEYNAGTWVIRASCKEDKDAEDGNGGRPHIFDAEGHSIFEGGELVADEDSVPNFGDHCWFLIRVWGMAKFDRINFELVSIRLVEKRKAGSGPRVSATVARDLLGEGDDEAFALIAPQRDEAEDEEAPKKLTSGKKSARKKKKKTATKSKAAPRKRSVFRD